MVLKLHAEYKGTWYVLKMRPSFDVLICDPTISEYNSYQLLNPDLGPSIKSWPKYWCESWLTVLHIVLQLHSLSRSVMMRLSWSFRARCCSTSSSSSKMVSFMSAISVSFSCSSMRSFSKVRSCSDICWRTCSWNSLYSLSSCTHTHKHDYLIIHKLHY